jgi:hypothetical protein
MLSYLSRFATRAPSTRVDERTRLNLPGFHGDAAVRVFVENTEGRRGEIEPRIRLKISDCDNRISLWFELDTPGERQNALHKIATLLGALHRFEEALKAEAELAARRDP